MQKALVRALQTSHHLRRHRLESTFSSFVSRKTSPAAASKYLYPTRNSSSSSGSSARMTAGTATDEPIPQKGVKDGLPELSREEFRKYNRMADTMEYYHNHFRTTWTTIYTSVSPSSTTLTPSLSAPRLITLTLSLLSSLHTHHTIEETHIFPVLATRMPAFRPGSAALEQHKLIHKGMDELEAYMWACKQGEREFRREEVRALMDGFGEVLWAHLKEEVADLGAERMRRYWSLEEIRGLPM